MSVSSVCSHWFAILPRAFRCPVEYFWQIARSGFPLTSEISLVVIDDIRLLSHVRLSRYTVHWFNLNTFDC